MEKEKVKGIVTTISQKEKGFGIALGKDNWYNGYGKCPVNKGDEVEIEYVEDGKWKNIKDIKVLTKAPEKLNGADENARKRRALDCIFKAIDYSFNAKGKDLNQDEIKALAKQWYDDAEEIANG